MEKVQRYLELDPSWQHDFLYPLIFREYSYVLSHDYSLNRSILFKNFNYEKKSSLLIVKRLITRVDKQNHLIIYTNYSNQNLFFRYNKNLYYQMISDGFSVLVEIPFHLRFPFSLASSEIVKYHNLLSIHSLFPFLEDNFSHLNSVLNILIPYPIHIEILVQIFRRWVKDVSSLHLLRFFLHAYWNWSSLLTSKNFIYVFSQSNPRFFLFLSNSYVSEYESIFLFLRKQDSHLQATSFRFFLERIHFYVKIDYLPEAFSNYFPVIFWLLKDLCAHYVRYQGKCILALKDRPFLMHKWKYYLVNLCQCCFYVWSQPEKIYINQLSKHSIDLLGYLSSVRLTSSVVRSQLLDNVLLIDNIMKKLDTRIPLILLIGLLVKVGFCNVLGNPISKPTRTDSSDSDIIDRFVRIGVNLSHYYSGSSKKKCLYRIKYILRLSCVKTLARKHKSTVRAFLNRLGSDLFENFFTEDETILSLSFPKASCILRRLYKGGIWYLDIVCINDLVPVLGSDK